MGAVQAFGPGKAIVPVLQDTVGTDNTVVFLLAYRQRIMPAQVKRIHLPLVLFRKARDDTEITAVAQVEGFIAATVAAVLDAFGLGRGCAEQDDQRKKKEAFHAGVFELLLF